PCHSPKAQTRTHKNFSSSLASSGPSPVNNTQRVAGNPIASIVTSYAVSQKRIKPNVTHSRFCHGRSPSTQDVARNEKDEAHVREAEARELLRIAKRKAKKTKLAL
ncbi:hypothetical protein CFP56_037714, partial [Quercus suber]